ncbi:hypothetical protein SUDANB176_02622 [Streptomyces sp. enrichment culture]|uniref:hypothetical protein n=1 Tax=Streptomyces sp. enrichment culture TaxID=1795815 RepID=UPI003F55CBDB
MTAHDDDRDRAHGGSGDDSPAESVRYEGMDPLMAALLDEPLPARARQDPAFLAAHGAAAADLAVLREQLALIGDALAAPAGTAPAGGEDGAPAGRDEAARPGRRPEPGDGAGPGGRARPPGGAGPRDETGDRAAVPGGGSGDRPVVAGARVRPGSSGPTGSAGSSGPARPGGSRGPGGPRRARRPLKVALGTLAAAAAATVVVGMGWLVAQGGAASDASADSKAAADSAAGEQEGGVAFGGPRYLACARLVAEGAVVAVEPLPGADRERIALRVTRAYKGTEDGHRVTFVLDVVGRPRLHEGDRVMIGMPPEGDHPDMVIAGEEDIAPERARITASLPESRALTCD